ncbi:MAG TPA: ABC transporter permease [Micromonosporaceae bacterium]|jgi:ABC-type multidrug transport system permease subunit
MAVVALTRRALGDIRRAPAGVIPDLIAPTFLFVAIVGMFGRLAELSNFGAEDYVSFLLPLGMVQAAGLVGSGAGVNVGRDVETSFFDRVYLLPIGRGAVLLSTAVSAAARALLSVLVVLVVGLAMGSRVPSIGGLLLALALTLGFAAVAACWGVAVALGTRSSSAAPMMQAPIILLLILGPAFAPRELLAGWLQPVATVNPVGHILEAVRAPFVGSATWDTTWPGLLSLAILAVLLGGLAQLRVRRWSL